MRLNGAICIPWMTWEGVAGGVGSIERVAGGGGEVRGIDKGGSVLVNYYDLFIYTN